jgi:hypothetical protein
VPGIKILVGAAAIGKDLPRTRASRQPSSQRSVELSGFCANALGAAPAQFEIMSLTAKLHLLLTATLLAAAAFLAHQWLAARDAYLHAEAQSKSSQSAIAQLTRQQSDLANQLKQAQSDQSMQLAALHKEYAQAKSPQQVATLLARAMQLPQPITFAGKPLASPAPPATTPTELLFGAERGLPPPLSAPSAATNVSPPLAAVTPGPERAKEASPEAASTRLFAEVPLADAPQAKSFALQCQECAIRLATAQKETALASQQLAASRQELSLTQKDRDAWKSAAKGGSWLRRATRRAAAFALDAALTTVALCASGHCK